MEERRRRNGIIVGVMLSSFLAALDTTILATAMPTVVGELGGLAVYSWVFAVYMIMTAVSMPVWGKLADTRGKREIFFWTVGIFLGGSALCGLSDSMAFLVAFRGVQGIGAGGLASVPFTMISTVYPVRERGKALGLLSSVWGISSVLGPALGSFLLMHLDWRWIFYVNLPIGILSMAIVGSFYRDAGTGTRRGIDYAGAVLLGTGILSLLLFFLWAGEVFPAFSPRAAVVGVGFLLCTFLFVRVERRVENPLLELGFFRLRAFWLGHLLGFLASFAMYGVIAYMPLFAQSSGGGTPVEAGIVITALSMSWSTASVIAGRLVYRLGERTMISAGNALMAGGFVLILAGPASAQLPYLLLCVVVTGLGMGCQTPSLMLTVQHSLDAAHVGVATSTQMLARTIGGALGVSVTGAAVAGRMAAGFRTLSGVGEGLTARDFLSGQLRDVLSARDYAAVSGAFAAAVQGAFFIGLGVVLIGAIGTAFLPRSTLHAEQGSGS